MPNIVPSLRALAAALIVALALSPAPARALDEAATRAQIEALLPALTARLAPGDLAGVPEFLAAHQGQNAESFWAHLLLMRRHLPQATWFFAQDALARPGAANALGNLGVVLQESYFADSGAGDRAWLDAAIALFRSAIERAPDQAAYHGNLGYGLFNLWQVDHAAADLAEAEAELRRATALDPRLALYRSHLAEVLSARGDTQGAVDALVAAHALDSVDPSFLAARQTLPANVMSQFVAASKPRCHVDFRCPQICGGGIIGGLNNVTCQMENSSAQQSCLAGKPYAKSYDCRIKRPKFGIMIPGLYPGFSVPTPWGTLDVIAQGEGRIEFSLSVDADIVPGLGGSVGLEGSYDPESGATIDEVTPGLVFHLASRSALGSELATLDLSPTTLKAEARNGGPMTFHVESFGGSVLKF